MRVPGGLKMRGACEWDAVAATVEFTIEPDLESFRRVVPDFVRVLDFGCGYGRIAAQLETAGYADVYGYDQSSGMIERGRRLNPRLQLHYLPGLPVPENESVYGGIVCCAVLTTIPDQDDRKRVLDEFSRLLAPGGVLYIAEFLKSATRNYPADGIFVSALGPAMKHFDAQELIGELDRFALLDVWEREDIDLRGGKAQVLHGLWRKC